MGAKKFLPVGVDIAAADSSPAGSIALHSIRAAGTLVKRQTNFRSQHAELSPEPRLAGLPGPAVRFENSGPNAEKSAVPATWLFDHSAGDDYRTGCRSAATLDSVSMIVC